jgi:hypothetical protein
MLAAFKEFGLGSLNNLLVSSTILSFNGTIKGIGRR